MRKVNVLAAIGFIVLLLISAKSKAQFSFGVFADPQLSWFNTDTKRFDPNGPVASFNVGFSAEKYFAERYALSTGLSLNSLGGNVRFDQDFNLKTKDGEYIVTAGNNLKLKAQYVTLPIGFKFRTNQIGYNTFYATIGLKGNIRLKGFAWEDNNKVEKETATDHFAWGFASYYIGAGMEYSLGHESALQFGVTFTDGFTEFLELENGVLSSRCLSLRIGVVF